VQEASTAGISGFLAYGAYAGTMVRGKFPRLLRRKGVIKAQEGMCLVPFICLWFSPVVDIVLLLELFVLLGTDLSEVVI
jgi:hypothetical protein